MFVLIPIDGPENSRRKFRIPRIADIFVQASEPRSWIQNRTDFFQRCDTTSFGQVLEGAREVPCGVRLPQKIGKVDFFEAPGAGNAFFSLGTSKIYESRPREAGNPPNRPSRIRWRRNFGDSFVWGGLYRSKFGYFDVK